jgi:hypothetical protein
MNNTHVYLYVVSASKDPDEVAPGSVPWSVGREIFFGPCKKRLRKTLRDKLSTEPNREVYIAGINGKGRDARRTVIWGGKLKKIMTFRKAWRELTEKRYRELRRHHASPIHVKPFGRDGYEHRSDMHSGKRGDDWVDDLTSRRDSVVVKGRTVRPSVNSTAESAFDRDACLLLEDIHYANKRDVCGIEIDEECVQILKGAQRKVSDISREAPFGRDRNGAPKGLRGSWLELPGDYADRFVAWLRKHGKASETISKHIARCGCR